MFDVISDRGVQFVDAAKDPAPNALLSDPGEEAFYLVEPTGMRRDKVQLPARVPTQPILHGHRFVRGVVVENGVDCQVGRHRLFDLAKEGQKLGAAMFGFGRADDPSSGYFEGGKKRERTVTIVVVCAPLGRSRAQGQDRLAALQRLDLSLLIHRQDQGVGWRIEIEADDVANLVDEVWIVGEGEAFAAMRSQAEGAPDAAYGLA